MICWEAVYSGEGAMDQEPAAPEGRGDGRRRPGTVQQAAHDLRQPVAAVLAVVSAALADPQVPDRVRHCLVQQIEAQAQWISKIIQDMLAGPMGSRVQNRSTSPGWCGRRSIPNSSDLCATDQPAPARPGATVCNGDGNPAAAGAGQCPGQRDACGRHRLVMSSSLSGSMATQNLSRSGLTTARDSGPPQHGRPASGCGLPRKYSRNAAGRRIEIGRLSSGQTLVRLLLPISTDGGQAGGGR